MKLTVLTKTFLKQYPDGVVRRTPKGKILVRFHQDGQAYEYSGSVYSVAERLHLIPEIDRVQEAATVAWVLSNGQDEVVAHTGLNDNLRGLHGLHDIDDEPAGTDEYDRDLAVYRIVPGRWAGWTVVDQRSNW